MRKKRENGMAKESGMGDFPRKQFESVLLHSLRIMDQNREYLQMHLARTGDERTRQALEDMGQESIRLERTLREMMGLLEVEMNDKPSMKPVDLCWILMEAAQIAPEIEKQLGIRLTVDHSPFRRCYVKADAQEAEQLLFHLLSNALRAVSPGGQIKIRLTRDDEDLYLIVEDDGCGIPEEKLSRLFTGMLDSEAPTDQSRSSMGIGLSVCSAIIKAHGGEIWANKRAGGGTEVGFRLEMEDENGE